jgi:hypothetical protein
LNSNSFDCGRASASAENRFFVVGRVRGALPKNKTCRERSSEERSVHVDPDERPDSAVSLKA